MGCPASEEQESGEPRRAKGTIQKLFRCSSTDLRSCQESCSENLMHGYLIFIRTCICGVLLFLRVEIASSVESIEMKYGKVDTNTHVAVNDLIHQGPDYFCHNLIVFIVNIEKV